MKNKKKKAEEEAKKLNTPAVQGGIATTPEGDNTQNNVGGNVAPVATPAPLEKN